MRTPRSSERGVSLVHRQAAPERFRAISLSLRVSRSGCRKARRIGAQPGVRLRGERSYGPLAMWIFRRFGGGRVSPSVAVWACGPARKNHCRTLGTFSFSRSAGLTPNACDVCQIVRSVAFWSPRSIPLMKARSTPIRSATASWLMPAASRNRRTFAPNILRISIRRIGSNRVFWRYVL